VDVLLAASLDSLREIKALGVEVRTVTSNGIMTATVPLDALRSLAALPGVERLEAAKRVRPYNDLSNALLPTPAGTTAGMNNSRALTGQDVIVGVIDSGLDWTHPDFIRDETECEGCAPQTRILYYWDQSDRDPGGNPRMKQQQCSSGADLGA